SDTGAWLRGTWLVGRRMRRVVQGRFRPRPRYFVGLSRRPPSRRLPSGRRRVLIGVCFAAVAATIAAVFSATRAGHDRGAPGTARSVPAPRPRAAPARAPRPRRLVERPIGRLEAPV